MYGYHLPSGIHRIYNKVQEKQLVYTKHKMVQAEIAVANMLAIEAENPTEMTDISSMKTLLIRLTGTAARK